MTTFDRVAKTTERASDRLREDAKIDEVAVRGVFDGAEPRKDCRIDKAPDPEKAVAHSR